VSVEEMWKSVALRTRADAALFERKFLDYRNKMLDILDRLEERNELPDLQNELKKFMQDEQGDVEFTS
jgi:hypothetical protein